MLELLGKCELVPASFLAEQLDLDKDLIRQCINYLKSLGLPVLTINSGYKLVSPIYLPSHSVLRAEITYPLKFYCKVGSTNTELMREERNAACAMTVYQSAGRGRRGQAWVAAPGCALMFSLADWINLSIHEITALPIWIGITVCQHLNKLGIPAQLKWPNDLWVDEAKIAGLLIETIGSQERSFVVAGLGLNLTKTDGVDVSISTTSQYLERPWSDTETISLIGSIETAFQTFHRTTGNTRQKAYQKVSLLDGRVVRVRSKNRDIVGVAQGIDEFGRLCMLTDCGLEYLSAADVSLRH